MPGVGRALGTPGPQCGPLALAVLPSGWLVVAMKQPTGCPTGGEVSFGAHRLHTSSQVCPRGALIEGLRAGAGRTAQGAPEEDQSGSEGTRAR